MYNLAAALFFGALILVFFILPWILTILNLYYLSHPFGKWKTKIECATWILGLGFTILLSELIGIDWKEVLSPEFGVLSYGHGLNQSLFFVLIMASLGVLGYLLLRQESKELSGQLKNFAVSCLCIGGMVCILWIVRVCYRTLDMGSTLIVSIYLCLFPFNVILMTIGLLRVRFKQAGR